jgi:hypothetical protein
VRARTKVEGDITLSITNVAAGVAVRRRAFIVWENIESWGKDEAL